MNKRHALKEKHEEEVKSQWWDEVLRGLAQRSGSAGNYYHNHIQCTSRASDCKLSSPYHHHSQQVSLRLLTHELIRVCLEDFEEKWKQQTRQQVKRWQYCFTSNRVTDSQGYQ